MMYTAHTAIIELPFDTPAVQTTIHYLHKATGAEIINSGPLYVLQAARNGILAKLRHGDGGAEKQRWAENLFEEYIENADNFATRLIQATPAAEISAFVCVPTTRPAFMAAYHDAASRLCSGAVDLTGHLTALPGWSSTKAVPLEDKIAQLDFHPPERTAPGPHLLVIDDVVNTGSSAAAVMQRITRHYSGNSLVCSAAFALWIDTTQTRPDTA